MAARRGGRKDRKALVASAVLMTGPDRTNAPMTTEGWQAEIWDYYDNVEELQFAGTWTSNALSRVNLVAARPPRSQGEEPQPIDLADTENPPSPSQRRAVALVEQIAGGVAGQGQILAAAALNLMLTGLCYLHVKSENDTFTDWRVCSCEEAKKLPGPSPEEPRLQVTNPETGDWEDIGPNDLLIKVWRSHPRKRHLPHSPAKACRRTLKEIVGYGDRIEADTSSRMVGNGLLVIPEEWEFAPMIPTGNTAEGEDSFVRELLQVAAIAKDDRASPAASLPLPIRGPGETADKIRHVTFSSQPLPEIDALRMSAIKRLALGLDMPPEVLLGMGESNHWSAWQVAEEAITLHVEPLAESIVQAITIGFLHAALKGEQLPIDDTMVWYDTTDLTTRPDRSQAAQAAYDDGVITVEAYLTEIGLDPSHALAAGTDEYRTRQLLKAASGAPTLAPYALFLAGVITEDQALAWIASANQPAPGDPPPGDTAPGAPSSTQPADRAIPETDGEDADSAALLAFADGLVTRAVERAGAKLVNLARKAGTAVAAADPMTIHTQIAATEFASIDALLDGAWDRVPTIAARLGIGAESLHAVLDAYTRTILVNGHAHEYDRLGQALGVSRDRSLVPA